MTTDDLRCRVSVATLDRVVFQSPEDGTHILALERKATLVRDSGRNSVFVRAQPFGGAVRILNGDALHDLVGDFSFDSERSESEQDFRLLIRPADWEPVKQFCIHHLQDQDDSILESDPRRELVEEFADSLKISLQPMHYTYQPAGFVVENEPTPTDNVHAGRHPTVRIYRIFEVRIIDDSLCAAMLSASERYSDRDLETLALEDAKSAGKGRANSTLTLPLKQLVDSYIPIPPEKRYARRTVDGYQLDVSVLAVLPDVDVPHLQRL
jgi:hypothetical protein